ncbi:MAG: hydrogenase formation protein HypD [Desulfovibrio sp.]
MSLEILEEFHDPALCRQLLEKLDSELDGEMRFMEVCGTHTVSIFQSGLRSLLPDKIVHLSGPGCPVCVTHESEIMAFLELAGKDGVIIATFGDLMRVPGKGGLSLKSAQAQGARINVVYSPFDALRVAQENPNDTVVFLAVGFETTAPTVAATIMMAEQQGIDNFKILCFHKLVPPALDVLLDDDSNAVDSFILPGHVATVTGLEPFKFVSERYNCPAVITGFEPVDILQALLFLAKHKKEGTAEVANLYRHVVPDVGNPKALEIMYTVFQESDALWRGLGRLPKSGLVLTDVYRKYDAQEAFGIEINEDAPKTGCKCGEILKGKLQPNECPLFKKACTPANPVGPCMVSTEGSCAAYFKYQVD